RPTHPSWQSPRPRRRRARSAWELNPLPIQGRSLAKGPPASAGEIQFFTAFGAVWQSGLLGAIAREAGQERSEEMKLTRSVSEGEHSPSLTLRVSVRAVSHSFRTRSSRNETAPVMMAGA